jgi:hypothetical protein
MPTATETPTVEASPTVISDDGVQVQKLVLQQGLGSYEGVDDTYLDAWFQTANMGEQSTLNVRQSNIRTPLLRYDLRSIPQDATVSEATLNLWVAESSGVGTICLQVYMMRRPWREDVANWIEADTGMTWAGAGAGGAAQDYEASLVDAVSFEGSQQWVAIDIAPAVQYWVQHPEANYGLVIKGVGATSGESRFASSQWETRQQRPKMLLSYEHKPVRTQMAWLDALKRMSPLQWLGIITAVAAALLLLVAAGIPSKVRPRH